MGAALPPDLVTKENDKKKIVVFVTHSLGELDVLFPLICGIKTEYRSEVRIVIGVKAIYDQYKRVDFYRHCESELGIVVDFLRIPNKFDHRQGSLRSSIFGRALIRVYFFFLGRRLRQFITRVAANAEIVMYETTNQLSGIGAISAVLQRLNSRTIVYHHGHSLNQVRKSRSNTIPRSSPALYLLFSGLNKKWAESLGYSNQKVIGFPKLYPEWQQMISSYVDENAGRLHRTYKEKFVLIYSRAVSESFMDPDKFKELYVESYSAAREIFGDRLIVVKPHPREESKVIEQLMIDHEMKNMVLSTEHAAVLASNAIVAISFWTSCVFDSLGAGTPTVEFYKEASRFRDAEPTGSLHRQVGIASVSSREELCVFLSQVKVGKAFCPPVVEEWRNMSNSNSINSIIEGRLSRKNGINNLRN